jgi:RNA 2',3'-cyclic 3'-phosphodiesterase
VTDRRQKRGGDPYAGIPGRRLFVGVALPENATTAIREVVEEVRAMSLPQGARDVRWVRLDGLHLTLRFLGPTPERMLGPTISAVETVAAAAAGPISIELSGAGTFPSGRRPRTLWIGVSDGVDALMALAAQAESALVGVGWSPDDRPFRPHLTLARSDGVAAGPLVAGHLAAAMADRRVRATVEHLGLFESLTGGGPARYVPVTLKPLGEMPGSTDPVYHLDTPDPP